MPVVSAEKLISLQRQADDIRNICILAHVDHGKTSLTDALLATNGIISPKLAGKIRYLDSRPDEQLRGITMESSAISLYFSMLRRPGPGASPEPREYLINLIDSPGHIDFSSEVSTASRLCDGAVVLVDAVEGVCSQTITVLRHSWIEKLKPLLVINKMDRLITELKMTPAEAYPHLSRLLEQVNAVLGSFFQGDRMEDDLNRRERIEQRAAARGSPAAAGEAGQADLDSPDREIDPDDGLFEEKDDQDLYFAPEKNNVIFSSAIDGWAFTIRQFAALYEKKLAIRRSVTEKCLWGNFYLDPKTKKVLGPKHLKGRALKPMFVQLVLEPVWAVYEATTGGPSGGHGDPDLLQKITKSLNITIPPHVFRSKDPRLLMTTVFSNWLPLSTAVLVSVIESLPSPRAAQAQRMPGILRESPGAEHISPAVRDGMINFSQDPSAPVVVYVSKMVSIPESELPENKRPAGKMSSEEARALARRRREEAARIQNRGGDGGGGGVDQLTSALGAVAVGPDGAITPGPEEAATNPEQEKEQGQEQEQEQEHLIGFARIFSGCLSVGDSVYVIPPKWSPADPGAGAVPERATVRALYMLMGRKLESLASVPAGVVFGIAGLEGKILKSGTLCTQLDGAVNLGGIRVAGRPIVRVALEPANPADLDKMIRGLRLLVQSDACAEYEQFESGEHVLLTAGELHLERCLTDLQERFARCEIQVGAPIVPFRESIVKADEMRPPVSRELGRGAVVAATSSRQVRIKIRVRPLPADVTEFLVGNDDGVKKLQQDRRAREASGQNDQGGGEDMDRIAVDEQQQQVLPRPGGSLSASEFRDKLRALMETGKGREVWKGQADRIVGFGPRRIGPNLLIDATPDRIFPTIFSHDDNNDNDTNNHNDDKSDGEGGGDAAADDQEPRKTPPAVDSAQLGGAQLADKIAYAFQLATAQGPLCGEPVQGIAVFVEEVAVVATATATNGGGGDDGDAGGGGGDRLGRLTSEVIKTVQAAIRAGFLDWSPRLLLAMYRVEIQASMDVLGRVYDVLTRRRGRVVAEAMNEGTSFYAIEAALPVAEAFGFAEEMRKRTSGGAQPQLVFGGFEVLDEDPFWVPFTDDDLEDLGSLADRENVAKRYMDGVRRRKGMLVEGRGAATDGGKQKTLKR